MVVGKPRRTSNETSSKAFEIAERRTKVAQYITARFPIRLIAEHLGVSPATVQADKNHILRAWAESTILNLDEHFLTDVALLDAMTQGVALRAMSGESEAINMALAIQKRRASLLGFNARDRRDQPIRFPAAQTAAPSSVPVIDVDGDLVADKSPVAAVFALLGGRRQSGKGSTSGPVTSNETGIGT
jgi:hypothetical protein